MLSEPVAEIEESEAYRTLSQRVGRRGGKLPADVLVRHILAIVPPEEWPVRVEAMDALLRRVEAAKRDGLRLAARPEGGRVLGSYATRRRNSDVRPYTTILNGVAPIEARCDCPDFLKNSLGACKHVLAVLDHIYARPDSCGRRSSEQASQHETTMVGLRWDPIRPLTGDGDWLDRVVLVRPAESERPSGADARGHAMVPSPRPRRVRRSSDRSRDDPPRRLALVEDVLRLRRPRRGPPRPTRRCWPC